MHRSLSPRYMMRVAAIAVMLAAITGVAPSATRAGAPGAPPPAVAIAVKLAAQGPNDSVGSTTEGVINRTGDAHLTSLKDFASHHTAEEFRVDGVTYISMDGEPFYVPEERETTGTPPECSATAADARSDLGDLPAILGQDVSLQDLGTVEIDGYTASHVAIHGGDHMLYALIASVYEKTDPFCALAATAGSDPFTAINARGVVLQAAYSTIITTFAAPTSSEAQVSDEVPPGDWMTFFQQYVAGGSMNIDLFLEVPGGFPRRVTVAASLPAQSITASFEEDITPLPAPVPISAPQ